METFMQPLLDMTICHDIYSPLGTCMNDHDQVGSTPVVRIASFVDCV